MPGQREGNINDPVDSATGVSTAPVAKSRIILGPTDARTPGFRTQWNMSSQLAESLRKAEENRKNGTGYKAKNQMKKIDGAEYLQR